MLKTLLLSFYKLLLSSFLLSFPLFLMAQNTITVCNTCPIKTIKEGIEKANHGDTVFIKSGIYEESNLKVDKSIAIIGEGYPVVDGKNQGEIFTVNADDITFDGLKIINVEVSYSKDYAAVRLANSNNFLIQNLIIEDPFFGLYIQKSRNGKIINNKILGHATSEFSAGNAIHLWHSKHVEILDNDVRGLRDGIYLEFSDNLMIEGNFSKGNVRYGLHFMMSKNDTVVNNIFENNGAGVAVMFSDYIDLYDNTFRENWGTASYGLLLKELRDSEIINNTFYKNTVGITAEGNSRIYFKNNDFESNGWAINVKGACYENIFTNNNFLYNSFDLSYNGRLSDNEFDRNYWSEYSGYDLDKDGIGDVPYRPVKLFSYVVSGTPEAIILLRSLFIDLLDFSERVSPIFTPDNLMDKNPRMKKITHDRN